MCDEARELSRAVTTHDESHPVFQPSPEPSLNPSGPPAPEESGIGLLPPTGERPSSAFDEPLEETSTSVIPQHDTSRKRKGSILAYDRIANSSRRDSMPSYAVKRSKKHPGQQQALDWLTACGKNKFDEKLAALLSQWGVKETYQGTCVLCPQEWSSLEPIHIMDLFDAEKCPFAGSGRLTYQYSDHATSFVRAAVWFRDEHWPRKGVELDNFLGGGPFKPMDASHLCHHDACIIHTTYEPAHINQDRKNCSIEAQSLRQQGLSVAERCDKHNPPCLMQVSSPVDLRNSGPLIVRSTLHCPLSKLTAFNSPTCAKPKAYRPGLSPLDREDIDTPLLNPSFRSHQVSPLSFRIQNISLRRRCQPIKKADLTSSAPSAPGSSRSQVLRDTGPICSTNIRTVKRKSG